MGEGNADDTGYAFMAEYTGVAQSIDLALYAKEIEDDDYDDGPSREGEVWVAIYEGQGFSNEVVKKKFTAAYETNSEATTLSTYTFDDTFSLTKGQWYTVGFSLCMRFLLSEPSECNFFIIEMNAMKIMRVMVGIRLQME